ncbi:MAG TPA: polymer-forming cytoskeletal protein [Candidatus Sulfomarinibacteraceae bacterium]|nr:polymer-forming cytoskeletal protein [Candidatus Sulfomarinibacteraceae bacterium]
MTTPNDAEHRPGFWRTLFQRGKASEEITDHRTGDLVFEGPVRVAVSGMVDGNLRAPQVSIEGVVQGLVVAYELLVASGGKLEGDAVAAHVDVAPGASVHGWVATVEASSFESLTALVDEEPGLLAREALRNELAVAKERIAELESAQIAGGQQAQCEAELEQMRNQLDERLDAFSDLDRRYEEKIQALAAAEQQNEELESKLAAAMGEAEVMEGRIESLESALQASVQHSADQEEALMRWQELAETTKTRVAELSTRAEELQTELDRRNAIVDELRREQENMHRLWEQAQKELQEAQAEDGALSVDDLHHELETARAELREQQEQLLWYRTSLTAIKEQLQEVRGEARARSTELMELYEQLDVQRRKAEKWQARAGRLSELLYDSVQQVKERETTVSELEARLAMTGKARKGETTAPERELRQHLRDRDAQIRALEADASKLNEQLEAQGNRLAEARADLAEMQVALKAVQAELVEKNRQANKVHRLAQKRIRNLEAALSRSGRKGAGQPE